MSVDGWNTVLVLGGIRSGKSEFGEALVADAAAVRYVATAAGGEDDPEWLARIEAHQRRRPQSWSTEETGADPTRLTTLLGEAKPDDVLLVDDLGGWVTALIDPARQPSDDQAAVAALADAVRGCPARLVLVSPEVGLSLVPATPAGRAFADALGTVNQALATACDRVAFVVAGQATWLKPGPAADVPGATDEQDRAVAPVKAAPAPIAPVEVVAARVAPVAAASTAPAEVISEPAGLPPGADEIEFEPGMDLPLPDSDAGPDARDRLATLDLSGGGIGVLAEAVEFAGATQGVTIPRPWQSVRVLLLSGGHDGGAAAGEDAGDVARQVGRLRSGEGVLARLAGEAGADVQIVRVPAGGPMEDGPVLEPEAVEAALRQGWALAEAAAGDGRDLLVLASCGVGTDAAATAIMAATTGAEPVAVLPRVRVPGGTYDDAAWMIRAAAVRDALHRIRRESRGAKDLLAQLGGADLAIATGVLLGAAARRLPVVLDGPVGIAAGLAARDLASQTRHWCLLPDDGNKQLVRQGADVLGLTPVVNLGLDLGEGANALAALPLLRAAIGLTGALGVHPALYADEADSTYTDEIVANDEDVDFAEPQPAGPGPASTAGA